MAKGARSREQEARLSRMAHTALGPLRQHPHTCVPDPVSLFPVAPRKVRAKCEAR